MLFPRIQRVIGGCIVGMGRRRIRRPEFVVLAGRWMYRLLPLILASFVSLTVLHGGVPALRHDWRIPIEPAAELPWIASLFSPWLPQGIGSAQPYPTFYLLGFVLWPLAHVLDAASITAAIIFSTIALLVGSAMRFVRYIGGDAIAAAAAGVFASLNPWVYSKYVAGHLLMILAYALTVALVAEGARPVVRRWLCVALAALCVTQLEFFLIVAPVVIVWSIRRGERRVLAGLTLGFLPVAFGIAASYGQVRSTPFNISWQDAQSVDPLQALLLGGYTFDYAHAFGSIALASVCLSVLAAAGVPAALNSLRGRVAVGIGLAALVFCTGTKGPIALPYSWAVLHVPEVGVYRELYDLIAIVAIAYLVTFAYAAARYRAVGYVGLAAAAAFAVPWSVTPPSTFFVSSRTLPKVSFPTDVGQRVALLPAFQPFSFEGRGSGVDPDDYVRTGRASPLNEFFPTYPVDTALASADSLGYEGDLRALGVEQVIHRNYFHSNFNQMKEVFTTAIAPAHVRSGRRRGETRVEPLLSLTPGIPPVASIANRPGEFAVFFGDGSRSLTATYVPTPIANDIRRNWIDARLAFPRRPSWGNAFGGLATMSDTPLPLRLSAAGTSLLGATDGVVVDDRGRVVAVKSDDLRWWPLTPGAHSLHCISACVVVMQARVPPRLREHGPASNGAPVAVRFPLPWLGYATLAPHASGTLRLNVRYSSAWLAYTRDGTLTHLRLATAFNGWLLRPRKHSQVLFVNVTAAAQFSLEVLAMISIAALCLQDIVQSYSLRRVAASSNNEGAR